MKMLIVTCGMAACLVAGYVLAQEEPKTPPANGEQREASSMVRHLVLFQFKADSPAEKVKAIELAFAGLENQIDEIADFEWGTDNSPEGLAKGFTHCFLVTFESLDDRDAYLPHPAHQDFVKLLRPHLEEVLVIDYLPEGNGADG
ncbi:MAG: Dabb family protein [Aeoliella sp.]